MVYNKFMLKIVLVGYDKMLYSLIEGIEKTPHKIVGVFRCDRLKYSPLELFLKDNFNPSKDFAIIKSKNFIMKMHRRITRFS